MKLAIAITLLVASIVTLWKLSGLADAWRTMKRMGEEPNGESLGF